MSSQDHQIAYRRALGAYATGVTVVAAHLPEGGGIGITVNSFHSISLDPPLVGWCIGKDSLRYAAFARADVFGVSVLAADQVPLAKRFATKAEIDRDDPAFDHGEMDAPLAVGAISRFICRTQIRHDAGDHLVLIGEVTAYEGPRDAPALTYHRGGYGAIG